MKKNIEIFGAREHNLKNIDVILPQNKLIVFTGISGSGKSSLAFDTIYAEGQRRYMESFSAYARSFIGNMQRPDVDKINGLSPVISIEQKTTSRNPRSTVGTVTEIYDFMRLLFARTAEAFSYVTGEKMVRQSEDQIIDQILSKYTNQKLIILAPVVKGRKGHYRELFEQIRKMGFVKVRVDGQIKDIVPKMQADRYVTHDIEIVIDRIVVPARQRPTVGGKNEERYRISQTIHTALQHGKGIIMIMEDGKWKMEDGKTLNIKHQISDIKYFSKYLMCPTSGISYPEPEPNTFSFNSPYGACPECKGLGKIEEITKRSIIPDESLSISRGGIAVLGEYRDIWIFQKLESILKEHKLSISTSIKDIPDDVLNEILYGFSGKEDSSFDDQFNIKSPNHQISQSTNEYEGILNFLNKQHEIGLEKTKDWLKNFTQTSVCAECKGSRLKKESLHFKIKEKNIADLAALDIKHLADWFGNIENRLTQRQKTIAENVLKEIRKRIGFLLDVGLDYLTLDRTLRTLAGGEAQRIRLATQIGTQLVGVLYILDEPSIGLHPRDNFRLLNALKSLRDLGNSVIVSEHDKDMMLNADFIVDIGPGAGRHGGEIVATGSPEEIKRNGRSSLTVDYLVGKKSIEVPQRKRNGESDEKFLILKGARGNNLKNITLKLPLEKMICITGVSGSGKSTLIHQTLFPILTKKLYRSKTLPLTYKGITGLEYIDKVTEVDQSPIGRTPRSNPATYTGVFSAIRALFSQLPESKIRGYKPGRFSFNVKGGRCETCRGGGLRLIEMDFLPDVHVLCESCRGLRYNRETLEVRFKGKSISDVLDMTVEQAVEFFEHQPGIMQKIKTMNEVGLGYITLGQHATTLSGGEAQRVKLSAELSKKDTGKTLYILDEPTTGLHFEDIKHLLIVLNKLVDKSNTVLIIEHNIDVIKSADHIIDLGPEGGDKGGYVVCAGSPQEVAKNEKSYTGVFLKKAYNKL
ncbi:MAG: excinuclease ABC subunit UvrA [Cytophagales bacterium]|nr:excinuclease ABC subunit UvrA [Cytophagales bacterium]